MNITLIRPLVYSTGLMRAQLVPFLGIAYLAAAARDAGYSVDIIDMCAEDIDHAEITRGEYVAYGMPFSHLDKRLKPSAVIGFSCAFSQDWIFNRELIQYVRRLSPESVLIAGGEHISALPEYCLDDCPQLDICVVGEGEDALIKLLDRLRDKVGLADVPSLVYRLPQGKGYCRTRRASRIEDIDKIPLPAWDLIPMENYLARGLNYHIKRGRTMPMLATRGCPYKCTFCSNSNMWGSPWVRRSARSIVDEMEYYIKRYKADNFVFSDLTVVVSREPAVNLCNEIINRKIAVTWQLPTLRTEDIDRSVIEIMRKAGCRELDFALESGSKDLLASVNKNNDPKKIACLIKEAVNIGMNMSINIILGLPKEGIRDFLKTYFLTMKLALAGLQEINVFPFVPYPGSRLFEEFIADKKIKLNDEYFMRLFGYADLGKAVSWSGHFGPITLSLMRLFLFVSFYGMMFISHPARLFRLIANTLKGAPATKLEGVMSKLFKNMRVYLAYKTGRGHEERYL